jgi:hypothetical protein
LVTERVLVIPVHSVTRYIQGHLWQLGVLIS